MSGGGGAGGALNLSLLSRGIGEVQKNGHEKVEVFLEPSDYYNFSTDRSSYLPPIQAGFPHYNDSPRLHSTRSLPEFPLPKTFTTRKGALLLFSEDLALKNKEHQDQHHHVHNGHHEKRKHKRHHSLHTSFSTGSLIDQDQDDLVLKSVNDLTKSILQYGSGRPLDDEQGRIYLKFIHRRREQWERQMRPGYSAKRYLSSWTRNWDDNVFENIVSKGYLTERSLFHYSNVFLPNLRRHLFHEDLSKMPQPYRLLKTMLMAPGSLSGYTFYRSPGKEFGSFPEEVIEEEDIDGFKAHRRPDTKRSIRVIRTTKDGTLKEVSYSALDKASQREVITDLLVKSAVHYALSKQEELMEESIVQALQSEHGDVDVTSGYPSEPTKSPVHRQSVPVFDMREAVNSLLDNTRGPYTLGAELPELDARSHSSDHTGSFRGGSVPNHAVRSMGAKASPRGSWPVGMEEAVPGREFHGEIPVAAVRDMSASSSQSSIPQLPSLGRVPLSPIRDVSRETTHLVALPPIRKGDEEGMPTVNIMPPTPQHTTFLAAGGVSQRGELPGLSEHDATLADVGGYNISNDSTPTGAEPPPPGPQARTRQRRDKGRGPKVTHGATSSAVSAASSAAGSEGSPRGSHPQVVSFPPIAQGHPTLRSTIHVPVPGQTHQPPERASVPHSLHSSVASSSSHANAFMTGRDRNMAGHRTARSLAGGSVESKSMKGSMIMAPDGEIISVGGSVGPPRPHDVGVLSDVLQQNRAHQDALTDESERSDDEPDEWKGRTKKKRGSMSSKKSDSKRSIIKRASHPRSSVTEQDILDTLTTHAQRVADSVLSNKEAGHNLEEDVKKAADCWMETHPSRSQSVQEALKAGAIEEIMTAAQANSDGGPTTSEYKDLIRQSLTTAVARAAGLDPDQFPEDAEISPDLLEALASQKLTPDDITIYRDEQTGRPIIKSRQEIAEAMGGVAEGHIYVKAGSEAGGIKRQMSIPADRASLVDNMDYDVISYGGTEVHSEKARLTGRSKAGSKPGSLAGGGTVADLKEHAQERPEGVEGELSTEAEQDEFQKRLQQLEDKTEGAASPPADQQSEKSGKTGVSQKTDDSKKKKEEPFVVGMPKQKQDLSQLFGTQGPGTLPQGAKPDSKSPVKTKKPAAKGKGKGKGKKGAKKGKKEEEAEPVAEVKPAEEAPPPPPPEIETKQPTPPPPVERELSVPKPTTASSSERQLSSPDFKSEESDGMEFMIIREQSSPEPELPKQRTIPPPVEEEEEEEIEEEDEPDNDEENALNRISNREARAAKRAAAAAKRKEEVERRRKEREEQVKREKEEQERQEQLRKEMEIERRRREEERRLRKQAEEDELMREEFEQMEEERKKKLAEEREKRAKEDYQRKLEELRQKQLEEDKKRMELQLQREKEEEERRLEEELMLSQMAEQERIEYEKKKKAKEEERKKKEEEERKKREEEARLAMEEARRLAEEMARKQAELEARLKFNRALQAEAGNLDHSHDINRAFVFSYFELLQWLGLDIPEFDLSKFTQQY